MKRLFVFILCLALPACALGVTEGVVENAPQVAMDTVRVEAETFYLPDASYYQADDGDEPEWGKSETYAEPEFDGECFYPSYQEPCLTSGEAARAKKLLAAYQAGEATGDGASVLEADRNVIVGVYALDPQDYDGETVYTLLPNVCLTDEQLLAIIDAYDRLGLTFDPDRLDYRNCMRGGGVECARFLTEEERIRNTALYDMIKRDVLPEAQAGKSGTVILDRRYYNGLPDFSIRPFRRMTDEELIADLYATGAAPAKIDYDKVEKQAREQLTALFGCPLSMELISVNTEGSRMPTIYDAEGNSGVRLETRTFYSAYFSFADADGSKVLACASFDTETGDVFDAFVHAMEESAAAEDGGEEISEAACLLAAENCAGEIGLEGQIWRIRGSQVFYNGLNCFEVSAKVEDGLYVSIYVGAENGLARGIEYAWGDVVESIPAEERWKTW